VVVGPVDDEREEGTACGLPLNSRTRFRRSHGTAGASSRRPISAPLRTNNESDSAIGAVVQSSARRTEHPDLLPIGSMSGCSTSSHFRSSWGVRERRGRETADDRWSFMDEFVVREGVDHEQGEVHPAGEVALEDQITHVCTPHR
jgi:hypothetical protein